MGNSFGYIQIPLQRIHLELTNVCNFNCTFCPKSVMTRPYGYIDKDLAKRAISEIASNRLCEKITFHVMGEPTLHPHFFEILEHSLKEGVKVGLTTNGSTLGTNIGKRLLEYDLHQMDVSLQTPDESSFSLRKSGSLTFQSYFGNLMKFFYNYHSAHPDAIFKFRIMNTVFKKEGMEAKIGSVNIIGSGKELRNVISRYSNIIYELLDVDEQKRRIAEDKIKTIVPYKWNVIEILPLVFIETYILDGWGHAFEDNIRETPLGCCFGMRDHFAILYTGDVVLCCVDFDGKTKIGNINNSSLKEILSRNELKEIIDGFKKYKLVHPYCKRCQGSTSFFSWLFKPVAAVVGLKIMKPFFYKHTKLL